MVLFTIILTVLPLLFHSEKARTHNDYLLAIAIVYQIDPRCNMTHEPAESRARAVSQSTDRDYQLPESLAVDRRANVPEPTFDNAITGRGRVDQHSIRATDCHYAAKEGQ